MFSQQQRKFAEAILGTQISGDILGEADKLGKAIKNQLLPKPAAAHFFGQGQQTKSAGESATFNLDPKLAQKLLDENHAERQRLVREQLKLFRGEK